MSAEFRFVEETHQYFLGEAEMPALTNILKDVGIIDDRWYKAGSANRGKAIHKATELLDRGELDWSTVDDRIFGWLEAYIEFKNQYPVKFEIIEEPTYHKALLYGCTPDRVFTYRKKVVLADLKSGGKEPWHSVQLTANAAAIESQGRFKIDELWGVYIRENGKFTRVKYERDPDIWNHILAVYRWANA